MNPIETKVIAAIAGGGLGGAIGQFLLWLFGVLVWHASSAADKATAATAAVPGPVSMLLVALIAAGGAGLAGYAAPHTSRPAVTPVDSSPVPSQDLPAGWTPPTASLGPEPVIQTPVVTPPRPPVVGPLIS
jgi:hypothetical protein